MIRKAMLSDVPALAAIASQTVTIMAEEQNDQWDKTYPLPEHFERDVQNGSIYVFILEDEVVGSITIDQDFSNVYQQFTWNKPIAQSMIFHRLVVNPTIRNKGIASKLMLFAEEHVKSLGYPAIKVDTYSLNKKAQQLFKKLNYQFIGEQTLPERANPFYFYEKVLTP